MSYVPAREQGFRDDVEERGEKFSKFRVAYSDFNFFLGDAKCENCVFFEPETLTCQIVEGRILPGGLCHFFTSNKVDPSLVEKYIELTYAIIPPYTTFVAGGILATLGVIMLNQRLTR